MIPRVLNKYKDKIPEDAVYIGRPGKWGNPFPMHSELDRDKVCDDYNIWIHAPEQTNLLDQAKKELKGKSLICYCAPLKCHGDILLKLSNNEEPMINHEDKIVPLEDGITHINCYSRGKTKLGRGLSNFARIGFIHHEWGEFGSVEAAWYWLGTGKKHDHLKPLFGFKAKEQGKLLPKIHYNEFMTDVEEAIRLKITQNPQLLEDFKNSTLPITHYYAYGEGTDQKVIYDSTSQWFEYYFNKLRDRECGRIKGPGQRIAIVGSRDFVDYEFICKEVLNLGFNIQEIVSGGARGVDRLAAKFAKDRNIPLKEFLADWEAEPKRAGFIRNQDIVDRADIVIAFWDGASPGTKSTIDLSKKAGKTVYIIKVPPMDKTNA